MSNFNKTRDDILTNIEEGNNSAFTYPLKRVGSILGGYPKGEFLVVGGRRTSGKSYFLLNNYVMAPIIQELKASAIEDTLGMNTIYISNKKSLKTTIERMVVNFTSANKKGIKVGTPSLYSTPNMSNRKISKTAAKNIVTASVNKFAELENTKKLHLLTGKFTVDSFINTINGIMDDFGNFNGDRTTYSLHKDHENKTTIIVIDDATGIFGADGNVAINNTAAMELALVLKDMARMFNALVVLGVPAINEFYRDSFYRGYSSTLKPYNAYCDRLINLHNPTETVDMKCIGYEMSDFTHPKTGINYFRFINILANHSGPSNVIIPLFLYPENGYFIELPSVDGARIDLFYDKVLQ